MRNAAKTKTLASYFQRSIVYYCTMKG